MQSQSVQHSLLMADKLADKVSAPSADDS